MKWLRAMATAVWAFSWGADFLSAAPAPLVDIQISFALPAQNLDFSDLDMRDENNRPVSAPQVRRRFDDAFNQNLNRLLIQNLTPLRRAFLDMLSRERDAFADWLERAVDVAQALFAVASGSFRWAALPLSASFRAGTLFASTAEAAMSDFRSLAFLLISTTRLLC